jgi:kynurenine formamidase
MYSAIEFAPATDHGSLEATTTLAAVLANLAAGEIEIVDLTAPLSERTPVISLPPERGQPWPFRKEVISKYDAAGPDVYWNNLRLSEHTGTHFDAPVHWISGKNFDDVSRVPPRKLIAPAVVLDISDKVSDTDFLLRREHVEAWCRAFGPLPEGGWLLYRTGWDKRGNDPAAFLNQGHTPGVHPDCARWLAEETEIIGLGVETVGTDGGAAGTFPARPYPCHWFFHGANKYGLTQLRNLARLPVRGAIIVAAPLPIVGGSGSPARVLALVPRTRDARVSRNAPHDH